MGLAHVAPFKCYRRLGRKFISKSVKKRARSLHSLPPIEDLIHDIRGRRVLLDADLAAIYGVTTAALNQAVKRNEVRFPADFSFQLTNGEIEILISQNVISKPTRGAVPSRREYLPSTALSKRQTF